MANVLKPKRSSTASAVPTLSDLADGEIAVNSADKKLYMRVGGIIVDITPAATWNGGTVTGASNFTGGLTVNGSAVWHNGLSKFQADFSNGTAANRAMFQSSTVNGLTQVAALPNGTSTTALLRAYTHSDVNNSRWISIYADSALGLLIEGNGNGTQAASSKD